MILEGNILKLLTSELIEFGISEMSVKKGLYRNRQGHHTWKHEPWIIDRRVKLIYYNSLPDSTKKKLPDEQALISMVRAQHNECELEDKLDAAAALPSLIEKCYNITDYHYFKSIIEASKASDLAMVASYLRFLAKYNSQKDTRKIGFNSKSDLRKATVELVVNNALNNRGNYLYGFKVTSTQVLQRKELAWKNAWQTSFEEHLKEGKIIAEKHADKSALKTLLHNNLNNTNHMIIGRPDDDFDKNIFIPGTNINLAEFHARKLIYLYMNPGKPNKLDFEQVYIRYCGNCSAENIMPCDISTVKKFLSRDEVKLYTTREREGMKEFDKLLPHTKGTQPKYSLSKGGYDGFQVDFYTKDGNKQVMLTVVAVFDYMSGAVTGYDVGMVEDGLMVRNMYRNHLNMTGGRSYMEIESDRFSGNLASDTKSIFEKCCNNITQPSPNDPFYPKAPNPKGRYVERLIQELNRLTQNFPGWKGTNFYTRDASRRPNQDYMEGTAVHTIEEGINQVIDLINIYNNNVLKSGKSRMQLFEENLNDEAPVIPAWSQSLILRQHTTATCRNGVIEITVNRRKYEYEFEQYEQFVAYMMKGYKVNVYYDETDMDSVDIFGKNEYYIATLGKLVRFNRAKAEQTPEDVKEWGRQIDRRNKTRNNIDRKSLEVLAAEHGIEIGGLQLEEARQIVYGAIEQRGSEVMMETEEVFADALSSNNAKHSRAYYEDRLIRGRNMQVPVKENEAFSKEKAKRDYYKNKRR